jgi:hypothetical protein
MLEIIKAVEAKPANDAMVVTLRQAGNGFFFRGCATYSSSIMSVHMHGALALDKLVLEFETDGETPIILRVTDNTDVQGAADAIIKWFTGYNEQLFVCPPNGSLPGFSVHNTKGKIGLRAIEE